MTSKQVKLQRAEAKLRQHQYRRFAERLLSMTTPDMDSCVSAHPLFESTDEKYTYAVDVSGPWTKHQLIRYQGHSAFECMERAHWDFKQGEVSTSSKGFRIARKRAGKSS